MGKASEYMVAIRLSSVIGEDRRLIIDLPEDTPVGPAELILLPKQGEISSLRETLKAAGVLVNYDDLDEDIEYVSDEEIEDIQLPPGAPSSEELIDEDRVPRF